MTCHHAPGDPSCSSNRAHYERSNALEQENERLKALLSSPDSEKFEIEKVQQCGRHLVLQVLYPNCNKCAYEGHKVMVFLNATLEQAILWKRIDPHFRDRKRDAEKPGFNPTKHAPGPAGRFPATKEGWEDALDYARHKERQSGTKP